MAKKISDEIRRWCKSGYDIDDLCAIADRIDSEMVELPKDADGVPIHVRDTVFVKFGDGEEETVSSITLTGGTAAVTTACRGIKAGFRPEELTHERPDSLNRIIDDIETFGNEAGINDTTVEFLCKIQERIYMLAKKEDKRS